MLDICVQNFYDNSSRDNSSLTMLPGTIPYEELSGEELSMEELSRGRIVPGRIVRIPKARIEEIGFVILSAFLIIRYFVLIPQTSENSI